MAQKGFLLVTMQPPPALEEEFNAWYDTEHIPERCAVPGFVTGLRFVCIDGHPRYLAMYDLESHDVLSSPGYLKVGYDNATPWTKRVTSRVKVWRSSGHQVYAASGATKRCARVLLLRFRGLKAGDEREIIAGARAAYETRPEVNQLRVLAHLAGKDVIDYMAFVELKLPLAGDLDLEPFGKYVDALDLANTYAPY
jgi:hypothetical protein